MAVDRLEREERFARFLAAAKPELAKVKVHAADQQRWPAETIGERRRRGRRRAAVDGARLLNLVEVDDGVLAWDLDGDYEPMAPGRRSRRGLGQLFGRLVEQFQFDPVRGSQVGSFLAGLDADLNPLSGLHRYGGPGADGAPILTPAVTPADGRLLLVVHGTFSRGAAVLDGLQSTPAGAAFLADARRAYDGHVYTFEHPTLSVSPILNALDLARAFAGSGTRVDVVCHSRGGLVTRWWLEKVNANPALDASVVFVGSPLAGTSLASPARLRHSLNLLTNVSAALHAAGAAASIALPLFGVVTGLVKLVASVTAVGARTPVVDAAVAMIPGLAAQSRIAENFELQRLRTAVATRDYAIVQAEFEPVSPGWEFWQYFTEFKGRAADLAADTLFPGPNDLVVDTASMNDFAEGVSVSTASRVLDFGRQGTVHHLNYFAQPETVAFLRRRLGV